MQFVDATACRLAGCTMEKKTRGCMLIDSSPGLPPCLLLDSLAHIMVSGGAVTSARSSAHAWDPSLEAVLRGCLDAVEAACNHANGDWAKSIFF